MSGSILPAFGGQIYCSSQIEFTHWSQIFLVVGFSYLWNLSLVLWTLPWNAHHSFPYLGSTLSVMFMSDRYGISIANWRQLGKKRVDESITFGIAELNSFKFFVFIFTLNSWILFLGKVAMFLTFQSSFYFAWNERGFTDFFNIEIALVTLLMISNIFFSFPILPSFQMAATKSSFILCCLYLIYIEFVATFILLCIQYPLLISVLYIGACIILTGMVLGMAILCLLAIVITSGLIIFWSLNLFTCLQFSKTVILRSFAASFTWLLITFLVWVSGICLSFLFTTSYFQSRLCLNVNSYDIYQLLAFIAVVTAIGITFISLFILQFVFKDVPTAQSKYKYKYQPVAQQ